MVYMVTFTINIPPMLPYIAYMDPMGKIYTRIFVNVGKFRPSLAAGPKGPPGLRLSDPSAQYFQVSRRHKG